MFTGIVEESGTVKKIINSGSYPSIWIETRNVLKDTRPGDSIAVNGVCLTVTSISGDIFTSDIMNETLKKSSLRNVKTESKVNLERAMAADGRFGGHIVSGHIDGTGSITDIRKDGNAVWFTITASPVIMKYIINKGSVALDGISLTVANVTENSFLVSVIPHTMAETCMSQKNVGDIINIENDCIGKYVEKLLMINNKNKNDQDVSPITESFLIQNGF